MSDWQQVISFESLYKAHRRARLGKRHKKEVVLFENNLSENLWAIHYELKYNKYAMGGYHNFTIYDPKQREIQAISYRDRIVQHSLCDNYLIPLFERHLIYDNAACRKNKGTNFAIKRLRKFILSHYHKYGQRGYFVKIDVRKYFDSIDHDILKQKLKPIIKNQQLWSLTCNILDSYNFDTGKGLPMGNQSSQCFALLYLDSLDRYFKEHLKIKYYIRYMDDIVIIVNDKATAQLCLTMANQILLSNKLTINPKSQIVDIKNGVEFLGWRFFVGDNGQLVQKLRRSSKKRIISKAKYTNYLVLTKRLSNNHKIASLASYEGFLFRGNTYNFVNKLTKVLS